MNHLENEKGEVVIAPLEHYQKSIDNVQQSRDLLCCVLDVETTHLRPDQGEVIQVAVLPFFCDPETGDITGTMASSVKFQEPKVPLTPETQELTGITPEQVKGQEIDWTKVAGLLNKCSLIVAHNASFDRKWVVTEMQRAGVEPPATPWACTLADAEWPAAKYPARSLAVLCAWNGFRYKAHNAEADTHALLRLIEVTHLMPDLLTAATRSTFRVFAAGSQMSENQLLKDRSYRWDGEARCWWVSVPDSEAAEAESGWLKEHLTQVEPHVVEVPASHRFA